MVSSLGHSGQRSAPVGLAGALGGVNLNGYCQLLADMTPGTSGSIPTVGATLTMAATGAQAAYGNWECEGGQPSGLNMDNVCQLTWSQPGAVAKPASANDAYSWLCFAAAARRHRRHRT